MNLRRWIPLGLLASVATLVIVTLYIQRQNGEDVLAILTGLDPNLLLLALALHLWMHVLWGTRIRMLAAGVGTELTVASSWRIATSGQFGGAVTPGRIGAEATRITLLIRGGIHGADASRIVLLDRASDIVFYALGGLIVTISLPTIFPGAQSVQAFGYFAVAALATFILVISFGLRHPFGIASGLQRVVGGIGRVFRRSWRVQESVFAFLYRIRDGIKAIPPTRMGMAAILSILLWLSEFGVLWVLFRAFGFQVPFLAAVAAGVLITMVAALPLSAGGAGIAEVTGLLLFDILAPGIPGTFVLVWRGLTYYYDVLIGGLVAAYSFYQTRLTKPLQPVEDLP